MNENEKLPPIEIPTNKLSQEVLHNLLEEFILREGTDYGNYEYSLEEKKQHLLKQLEQKKIKIVYDPNEETTTLILAF
ncbi:MAG: YheU family protein [Bdellovibrionales bacterium]|nr:YheU family protein [Bdellovibrionales bacterium]